MNITGSFSGPRWYSDTNTFYIFTGAFWTSGNTGSSTGIQMGPAQVPMQRIDLDASKAWTGETSAVGGGASHTHGIKMIINKIKIIF